MTPCGICGSTDHGPGKHRIYDCWGCGKPLDPAIENHVLKGMGIWHYECAMREPPSSHGGE